MSDFECPYCGEDFEVCNDDGHGYDEAVAHEDECGECGKNFIFYTTVSFHYTAHKADCLNGAEHNWKDMKHMGGGWTYQVWKRCRDCEHEVRIP